MSGRRLALLAFAAGSLLAPGPALACKQLVYPDHIRYPYDAAVVVSVRSARFEGDQSRFFFWGAQGEVRRVLKGQPDAKIYGFGLAWESALCGRNKPPPAPGELWVLYLTRENGRLVQSEAYPLDVARRIDPQLRP